MLNLRLALLFLSAALFVVFCNAQNGREDMSPEDRALYDMNVGLAGMKEAGASSFLAKLLALLFYLLTCLFVIILNVL